METIIVSVIIIVAAVYVGRTLYKGFKQEGSCGCSCSGCSINDTCNDIPKE